MIDVSSAKQRLNKSLPRPVPVRVPLKDAFDHVLSKDIRSGNFAPLFDQSAVDGYVLVNGPFKGDISCEVVGEIKAGDAPPARVRKPSVYRIYTGAPVPKEAWSVVMQEKVTASSDMIHIPASNLQEGSNIRRKGNHFGKGELLLKKGTRLSAASIGLLAATGISEVDVYRKPSIGIIVTGSELVSPGEKLLPGKIYESNSFALRAALLEAGFEVSFVGRAVDRRSALDRSLARAMKSSDVILLTGGISVGKYDLVHDALKDAGVREIFYKVAQKPGKPLFAGKKEGQLFFGLPGNPAAVLVCFHQYVLPSLRSVSGRSEKAVGGLRLPISDDYEVRGDRDLFLRAKINDGAVEILSGQDSDNLLSFAHADALVYLSKERRSYRRGDPVDVVRLGGSDNYIS
jgi:molybdopterin molybdotransferase